MANSSKILLISPKPPPWHGGAIAAQIMLESPLVNERHDILHIDAKYADSVAELQGLSWKKITRLYKYLWQMANFRFRENVEAVILTPTFYFGSFLKDSLFIWLAWALGFQNRAAWFHMSFVTLDYYSRGFIARWYIKHTLLRCNHFILQSDSLRGYFPDFINMEHSHVISNGVDGPANLELKTQSEKSIQILYLSNMDEAKGWRVLFSATERLIGQFPELDISVCFIGGETKAWPLDEIKQIFAAGVFPEKIIYTGFVSVEEKEQALRNADIFVLPSFNEAFPLTVLEAMAYGLPVIASDVGAVKDALINRDGGYLTIPQDENSLYEALAEMTPNAEMRSKMGKFNRSRFLKNYTKKNYCERWDRLLKILDSSDYD